MKHFYLSRIFSAALLAGLFMTQSASAQQKEYTDGVFMLNEGSYLPEIHKMSQAYRQDDPQSNRKAADLSPA